MKNPKKKYIETKKSRAIRTVLSQFDFGKIAIDAEVSISTVNNILNGTQAITKNNGEVINLLTKRAGARAKKILKELTNNTN
jgi:hypothetical protein